MSKSSRAIKDIGTTRNLPDLSSALHVDGKLQKLAGIQKLTMLWPTLTGWPRPQQPKSCSIISTASLAFQQKACSRRNLCAFVSLTLITAKDPCALG